MDCVTYYRVSTAKQGKSGLGLEAQKQAVEDYVKLFGLKIIGSFTDIESGSQNDRRELQAAMDLCRKKKARLIIAKLDRLSRNLAFIAKLMESKVKFTAADMQGANEFTVHIMAAMAQHEREVIGQRTKAALSAARARGQKLGFSRPGAEEGQKKATRNSNAKNAEKAEKFRRNVKPIIAEIERAGVKTLAGIAEALNARGIQTANGGGWYPTTVKNILKY